VLTTVKHIDERHARFVVGATIFEHDARNSAHNLPLSAFLRGE
jgi:hypothetical protein